MGNTNGARNIDVLNKNIIPQLNIACGNIFNLFNLFDIFNRYWWVQDGGQANSTLTAKDRLLEFFQNRIISLGRNIEWASLKS